MKKILIVDDMSGWRKYNNNIIHNIYQENVTTDCANSAREGYELIYNNLNAPYDAILTDLQMEEDFLPKYAGEWLIEQVKLLNEYKKTKIVIISATYNIQTIAETYGVLYIPKRIASTSIEPYKEILGQII